MRRTVVFGMLLSALIAGPSFAGEEKACLQNNRVWGWQAVNDRTLIITDRQNRRFTVSLSGGCINLAQYVSVPLELITRTSLGCLTPGDRVRFRSPGLGPLTCFVSGVEAEAPKTSEPNPDAK